MTKRRILWACIGLLAILAALLVPWGIYFLPAYVRGEHFYRGRPTSYWSGEIKRWRESGDPDQYEAPLLDKVLNFLSNEVRTTVPAVRNSSDPAAIRVLIDLLEDDDSHVRLWAQHDLAVIDSRSEEAVARFVAALKDPNPDIRGLGATFLGHGHSQNRAVVPALGEALRDNVDWVRLEALEALANFGPEVVPQLARALNDPKKEIRCKAICYIARYGQDAREAVPSLIRVARKDEDENVRQEAVSALQEIDPAAAVEAGVK